MSDYAREPLVIEVRELPVGIYVVAVSGEMDIATSPELMSRLSTVRGPVPYYLLIDLSELTFMDSTGIKALVTSAKDAESRGGRLIVVAPTANIRRVFDIVHLSEVLSIVDSLDAAILETQIAADGAAPKLEA
jgi:anti-sigma B factor antagonist